MQSKNFKKIPIYLLASLLLALAVFFFIYICFIKPDGIYKSLLVAEKTEIFPGEREVKALKEAYDEISGVEIREGDWSFLLKDRVFYWAGGRLLPEDLIKDKKNYDLYKFYDYPLQLPKDLVIPSKREKMIKDLRSSVRVCNCFLDTLYEGTSYKEIRKNIETISFLGFSVNVHKKIVAPLRKIEEEIFNLKAQDENLEKFIKNLKRIDSLSWRNVDKSVNRSLHSYGIAIDLIPTKTGGRQIYWAWTRHLNSQWYSVPYEKRWMVPEEIVEIFEKYGFVWGGKWVFYDNMHFEYRPELLIFAGRSVETP